MFYISTGSMGNLIFRERMDGGTGTAEEIIQELIPLFDNQLFMFLTLDLKIAISVLSKRLYNIFIIL